MRMLPPISFPYPIPAVPTFGPNREKFSGRQRLIESATTDRGRSGAAGSGSRRDGGVAAASVASAMPSAPGGSRTDTLQHTGNNIDKYLFQAMADAGVAPAPPTTDFEFVRRVTLDLTGTHPHAGCGDVFRERRHVRQTPEAGGDSDWLHPNGWTNGPSGSATSSRTIRATRRSAIYPGRGRVQRLHCGIR